MFPYLKIDNSSEAPLIVFFRVLVPGRDGSTDLFVNAAAVTALLGLNAYGGLVFLVLRLFRSTSIYGNCDSLLMPNRMLSAVAGGTSRLIPSKV